MNIVFLFRFEETKFSESLLVSSIRNRIFKQMQCFISCGLMIKVFKLWMLILIDVFKLKVDRPQIPVPSSWTWSFYSLSPLWWGFWAGSMVILQYFGFLFDLEHSSRKIIPQTLNEYLILLFFSYEFLRKHLSPQRFSIVFLKGNQ